MIRQRVVYSQNLAVGFTDVDRVLSRFNEKYFTEPNSGCWLWSDAGDKNGYGRIQIGKGNTLKAHRISHLLFNGPVPNDLLIIHNCDTPPCVNPKHLRLGTIADNNKDMMSRGRYVCGGKPHPGEKNGRAKLTEKDVNQIRFDYLMSKKMTVMAQKYGVHVSVIDRICHNRSWKHLGW